MEEGSREGIGVSGSIMFVGICRSCDMFRGCVGFSTDVAVV